MQITSVNDEKFDDVVKKELEVVKQLWTNMAEKDKPLMSFVSRSRKKKNKKQVRSANQPII
ncbi:hypothetical protein TSUD_146410 [Trifolium subterraneum]|uniref:Uncharacterized protein n=1 Tax=Trifolium subterraneum TaxID=3900 RepID=A0A2Z6MPW7_TRISU|nr:hypothetical protein TSUD_146410 [Trifolium subterraneum]